MTGVELLILAVGGVFVVGYLVGHRAGSAQNAEKRATARLLAEAGADSRNAIRRLTRAVDHRLESNRQGDPDAN